MNRLNLLVAAAAATAVLGACAVNIRTSDGATAKALDSIAAADLLAHIRVLASDEFEGRLPGTRGEELTVQYLAAEFRRLGLAPGNPDGTYVQSVPLAGITGEPKGWFKAGKERIDLDFPANAVATTSRYTKRVAVKNSDMVFVGYGVVAPEYGWDDYKGLDVRGKTIVMLINDPAVTLPEEPARLDERYFKGKSMTYYGRWTYKYEIASQLGAAAAVIIHETEPAGYPWEVVADSWSGEQFDIQREDNNLSRVAVESWISLDQAKALFAASGVDFDMLKKAATRPDFKPVPLLAKADFRINNELRQVQSRNVIAKLEGSDPQLKAEHMVYTAHWDHLGRDRKRQGDQIFNGAIDNASGTAGLLELAEAFAKLPERPKRSLLFLAVTAEEQGLIGSRWYAGHPLYALTKTVGNINMDGVNQWGRTQDVVVVGSGQSTLEDTLLDAAKAQNRALRPDPESEKGFYYRSDHFEFAKVGVPALYVDSGTDYIGKSANYGMAKRDEYTVKDYHKPSDEIKADWDLSGAVEDLQLLFDVGYRVAQAPTIPEWKPGSEFKAVREASLKTAR